MNSWPATKKNSGIASYPSPLKFGLVVDDLLDKRAASEDGVHLGSITRFEPKKQQMPVFARWGFEKGLLRHTLFRQSAYMTFRLVEIKTQMEPET